MNGWWIQLQNVARHSKVNMVECKRCKIGKQLREMARMLKTICLVSSEVMLRT